MIYPEFMVRVKLPNPNGYASCPSGDTDYEVDYNKAMKAAVPVGFEVVKERLDVKRPTDSTGHTYVRLRCINPEAVMAALRKENQQLRATVSRVRAAVLSAEG